MLEKFVEKIAEALLKETVGTVTSVLKTTSHRRKLQRRMYDELGELAYFIYWFSSYWKMQVDIGLAKTPAEKATISEADLVNYAFSKYPDPSRLSSVHKEMHAEPIASKDRLLAQAVQKIVTVSSDLVSASPFIDATPIIETLEKLADEMFVATFGDEPIISPKLLLECTRAAAKRAARLSSAELALAAMNLQQ